MEWAIEAAKQVPALAVLVWLVVYFLTHISKIQDRSEQRIQDICAGHETRQNEMNEREADMLKTVSGIIATNNEVLGSIKTLLTMQVRDERNERQRHTRRSEEADKS